jgi:hypothetical protein
MARLAGEYDLAITPCDDIYSAATELAGNPGRYLMVAGPFHQLAKGKCDFVALAKRRGVRCCCLLDGNRDPQRERILAAVRKGVHLAGGMTEVREFLEDQLAAKGLGAPDEDDLFSGEFRATEDKLKELLRQETDG